MFGPWQADLESLEAISQNAEARAVFLKLAALSQGGRLARFLAEIDGDRELDDATKRHLAELARDRLFLLTVDDYLRQTARVH
jgi:hypothetical protein